MNDLLRGEASQAWIGILLSFSLLSPSSTLSSIKGLLFPSNMMKKQIYNPCSAWWNWSAGFEKWIFLRVKIRSGPLSWMRRRFRTFLFPSLWMRLCWDVLQRQGKTEDTKTPWGFLFSSQLRYMLELISKRRKHLQSDKGECFHSPTLCD